MWIEIANFSKNSVPANVTPYAGVWIEIISDITFVGDLASLPTRECGLKFKDFATASKFNVSLPTRECGLKYFCDALLRQITGHSLRGSVD